MGWCDSHSVRTEGQWTRWCARRSRSVPWSSAAERTIDITTTGNRTGRPRRIEIWFYRAGGRLYLSGTPGRRAWAANLRANPAFTFHLKNGVVADLPATATEVTDEAERRAAFAAFVDDLNQPHDPGRIGRPTRVEDWLAGSPLFAIQIDGYGEDPGDSA